ncbi:MAG: hypothetical protein HYW88_00010, partial [Candidatus Sungbacteria bacterium]|nr:hypothetical protein [Candidatus Sungbacteria bacterium]
TWLYTHGIDFVERTDAIEAFFAHPSKDALKGVPADYLVIDSFLRKKYPQMEHSLEKAGYREVFRSGDLSIVPLLR